MDKIKGQTNADSAPTDILNAFYIYIVTIQEFERCTIVQYI